MIDVWWPMFYDQWLMLDSMECMSMILHLWFKGWKMDDESLHDSVFRSRKLLDMHQMPVWTSTTLVIICLSNTTLFDELTKRGRKGIHYKR